MAFNADRAVDSLQAVGPDEYPRGFYQSVVNQKVAEGIDWQQKFKHLYEAVAGAEAPEGTQVDDALRAFQIEYHLAKSGDA